MYLSYLDRECTLCLLCVWKICQRKDLFLYILAAALGSHTSECFHCILLRCNKINKGECFPNYRRELTGIGTLKLSCSTTHPLVLSPLILPEVFSNALFYVITTAQPSRYWEVIEKAKKLTLVKMKEHWIKQQKLEFYSIFLLLSDLWPQTSKFLNFHVS